MMCIFKRYRNVIILTKRLLHNSTANPAGAQYLREKIKSGPGLKDFISPTPHIIHPVEHIPYIEDIPRSYRKVYFDVYGCQMNVNDTEIVWSILKDEGFERTEKEEEADVVLVMTCAIREGAESKIWNRLNDLRGLKRRKSTKERQMKVGILGCMAERLKEKLIEKEKIVDIVCGPDSYRDLPRLLTVTESGQAGVNVLLSLDETYADVMPVRLNQDSVTAFVSIMRGCDNMCTYCIVPFTRGRERSRPIASILEEVRILAEQGVKEVTLLGQNVNSYRDTSEATEPVETQLVEGFRTVYKKKRGGLRFSHLLDKVSAAHPEMRIRFTSPHPKDFPDEVIRLIGSRSNVCSLVHLPAQSGSSAVLERMRRGYTREAYLALARSFRQTCPEVAFSSDFICGFCGETESEFAETLSLMQEVDFPVAFLFAYSMREKTAAHRRYTDDVPQQVKLDRLARLAKLYRSKAEKINREKIGTTQLILVEGKSKRSDAHLAGRNDHGIKVIVPQTKLKGLNGDREEIRAGDFISVSLVDANSQVFKGEPICKTTIGRFHDG